MTSIRALLIAACLVSGAGGYARPEPADPLPPGALARIGTTQFRQVGWHKRAFFSADGKTLIVTGRSVVGVQFWDVETGRKTHHFPLPNHVIHSGAFASDASILAVIGTHWPNGDEAPSEAAVWLVDTVNRKVVQTLRMPDKNHTVSQSVRITPDGQRVFTAVDGEIRVWHAKTGVELSRFKGHAGSDGFTVSQDGKLIAFGRNDVFLWKWEKGEEPKHFLTVSGFGTELIQFAPDGKSLVVETHGGIRHRYDVATGKLIESKALAIPTGALEYSPDGKTLAVASRSSYVDLPKGGHTILLIDAVTGAEKLRLPLGPVGAESVSWSKDGTRLVATTDYRLRVWDATTGKVLGPNQAGHDGHIASLSFAPDGTLFTASDDHTIRSWDAATGKPGLQLEHASWVRGLAISPDGALVVGSALRNDLRIWDAKTGQSRFKLFGNASSGGKRLIRFTSDGKRLIAWCDDEYLRVWEVRNGKLLAEHSTRPPGEKIDENDPFAETMRLRMAMGMGAADISEDGSAFALAAATTVRLIDPTTGTERQKLDVGPDSISGIALSPDGKRLFVANHGKQIQTKLANGQTQFSNAPENPVSVWDVATGKPLWTAMVEGSWPGLAYSPDGKRVAVVKEARVRIWDAASGIAVGQIALPSRGFHVTFDQTGKRLAVSFDDTTGMVFDLEAAMKAIPTK